MKLGIKSFFLLATAMFLLCLGALKASAQNNQCPTVSVSSTDTITAGQPITYTINLSGGDPKVTPTFNWSVSNGKISSGQGTSSITVDTKNVEPESSITATVDVGGYDRYCPSSGSSTTMIAKKMDEAIAEENFNLGNEQVQKGDYSGAIKSLTECLRLYEATGCYTLRGRAYMKLAKYDLAAADYTKTITMAPKDASLYQERAEVYFWQNKYDLALADYNKAIALNPKEAEYYRLRGVIYLKKRSRNLAIASFRQALKVDPNNQGAKKELKDLGIKS